MATFQPRPPRGDPRMRSSGYGQSKRATAASLKSPVEQALEAHALEVQRLQRLEDHDKEDRRIRHRRIRNTFKQKQSGRLALEKMIDTPYSRFTSIASHHGINRNALPPIKAAGVPLVPSLINMPRVNMNERSARCHSPQTMRERAKLSGILNHPQSPGRGPPLTARSHTMMRLSRNKELDTLLPGRMLADLDSHEDRLAALENGPATGTTERTSARRVRSWLQCFRQCNFPLTAHSMKEWTDKMREAIRPMPPPVDLSKKPPGTILPPPTPDRSIGLVMDEETWYTVIGRRIATQTAVYPGSPIFDTVPWLSEDQVRDLFEALSVREHGLGMPPTINFGTFGTIICCLLCEDVDRFTEAYKHLDIDDVGHISWEKLCTVILVAAHGDPLFNADLLNYFKCKLNIEYNQEGEAVRPARPAMVEILEEEGFQAKKPDQEVEEVAMPLEPATITFDELSAVVHQMDAWLNSTGWEWPTWMRPMSAGPMGPMNCGHMTTGQL